MENIIERKLLLKYPWLPGTQQIFESDDYYIENSTHESKRDPSIYFKSLIENYFEKFLDLKLFITKTFIYSLEKREEGLVMPDKEDFNIIYFYVVKTILAAMNNKMLDNHVANFISSIFQSKLLNEEHRTLAKLANHMELKCKFQSRNAQMIDGVKYPYMVDFEIYIASSSLLKSNSWSIINRNIKMGKVYLLKHDIVRLLKEKIRIQVIPKRIGIVDELFLNLQKIPVMSHIFNAIDNKMELVKLQQSKFKDFNGYEILDFDGKPSYELYPPCIRYILDNALDGVNLTHNERLHIAFFFANTHHTVEETIDVFRTVPDFNEEIARYNVEFSRGIGGKGKKYKAFNCAKLKSLQMCKGGDESNLDYKDKICYQGIKKRDAVDYSFIKSPLNYLFWKRLELSRLKKGEKKPIDEGEQ